MIKVKHLNQKAYAIKLALEKVVTEINHEDYNKPIPSEIELLNRIIQKVLDNKNFDTSEEEIRLIYNSFDVKKIKYCSLTRRIELPYDRKDRIIEKQILEIFFCQDLINGIFIPTYQELVDSKELSKNWQLCQEYEDYDLESIISSFEELVERVNKIIKMI